MDVLSLVHHLKSCPEILFQQLDIDETEKISTCIFVKDTYRRVFGNFNVTDSKLPTILEVENKNKNQLFLINLGCWLFSHPFFHSKLNLLPKIHTFLFFDLMKLSALVNYRDWLENEDRAEEFVRLALCRLDIIPDDETSQVFLDRLDALDTIKRQKVLAETNESFERIKEIRRQMAEKKAREAANVYGRE